MLLNIGNTGFRIWFENFPIGITFGVSEDKLSDDVAW